jgi:hypothetical protein
LRHRLTDDRESAQAGLDAGRGATQGRQSLRMQTKGASRLPGRQVVAGQRPRGPGKDALGFDRCTAAQRVLAGQNREVERPIKLPRSLEVMGDGGCVLGAIAIELLAGFGDPKVQTPGLGW